MNEFVKSFFETTEENIKIGDFFIDQNDSNFIVYELVHDDNIQHNYVFDNVVYIVVMHVRNFVHNNDTRNYKKILYKPTLNTDVATINIIAAELKRCCNSWDPKSRLLGNIQAKDIIKLCDALLVKSIVVTDNEIRNAAASFASEYYDRDSEEIEGDQWCSKNNDFIDGVNWLKEQLKKIK